MSYFQGIKWIDTLGAVKAFKNIDDNPKVVNQTYLEQIAEGNVSGHAAWSKVGYNPAITTNEEDVWSGGGSYAFPATAAQWDVDSSDVNDLGTVIKGNAEGAAQTIVADASTTTTLVDADVNFSSATAVAVGDCILLDPKGTTPEWGYVTDITNAATGTLGVSGGFSSGGVPTGRAYTIVDKSDAVGLGAQVVKIDYLDSTYAAKSCLVCLNGTTNVPIDGTDGNALTTTFRVNSFIVIAVGVNTAAYPQGNLTIVDHATGAIVYSYITAGYTRARNNMYTVPFGKTLYVNMWHVGAATNNDAKVQTVRMFTRANREPSTGFLTGSIFYPYTELLVSNGFGGILFPIPTKLPATTDIKVSAIGLTGYNGPVTSVLRGWLE
jgi:hypothetical protein